MAWLTPETDPWMVSCVEAKSTATHGCEHPAQAYIKPVKHRLKKTIALTDDVAYYVTPLVHYDGLFKIKVDTALVSEFEAPHITSLHPQQCYISLQGTPATPLHCIPTTQLHFTALYSLHCTKTILLYITALQPHYFTELQWTATTTLYPSTPLHSTHYTSTPLLHCTSSLVEVLYHALSQHRLQLHFTAWYSVKNALYLTALHHYCTSLPGAVYYAVLYSTFHQHCTPLHFTARFSALLHFTSTSLH